MTNDKQQRVTVNPNPTYIALSETEELNSDLEEARLLIATIKQERDSVTSTVSRLDIEIAKLKDENAKLEQTNKNMLQSFQELYNQYIQLYDQVSNTSTALAITTGKLSESLVKYKFTIPQQEQQKA